MMKWLIDLMMTLTQSEPLPREPGNGPVPLYPDQQRLCVWGGVVITHIAVDYSSPLLSYECDPVESICCSRLTMAADARTLSEAGRAAK